MNDLCTSKTIDESNMSLLFVAISGVNAIHVIRVIGLLWLGTRFDMYYHAHVVQITHIVTQFKTGNNS